MTSASGSNDTADHSAIDGHGTHAVITRAGHPDGNMPDASHSIPDR
jgi:hypothetical protein